MLFTQFVSRVIASIAICVLVAFQLPAQAEISIQANQNVLDTNKSTAIILDSADRSPADARKVGNGTKNTLLACATCGCNETCAITSVEASTIKSKDSSLLTDSLWGNLILQMAYQRDKELKALAKKLNIVNLSTMGAIMGITGGTLAQSITALYTLNPPGGQLDSYAPGIVGTSLSGLTIITFAARTYFNHKYQKKLRNRQLAIKNQAEQILHHLEYSECKCQESQKELAELIGNRASNEFIQLWQSSHQLAAADRNNISYGTSAGAGTACSYEIKNTAIDHASAALCTVANRSNSALPH